MVLICTAIFREHFPLLKPNRTTVFYEGCWAACGWTRNQEPRYYILSQSITCHHVTIMGNWEFHPVLCNHVCVLKIFVVFLLKKHLLRQICSFLQKHVSCKWDESFGLGTQMCWKLGCVNKCSNGSMEMLATLMVRGSSLDSGLRPSLIHWWF